MRRWSSWCTPSTPSSGTWRRSLSSSWSSQSSIGFTDTQAASPWLWRWPPARVYTIVTTPSSLHRGIFHLSHFSPLVHCVSNSEANLYIVLTVEIRCTVPGLWREDAVLNFSRTLWMLAPARLGSPCLVQERQGVAQAARCSSSNPQRGKACKYKNISTFPQRYFHFQRYSEDLKISSWALRTSFRGKLDRQNSPSAKNRSLEICLNRCSLCWHSSHSNNALSSHKSRNLTVVSMWWISAWSLERPRREEQTRNMRRSRRSSPDLNHF